MKAREIAVVFAGVSATLFAFAAESNMPNWKGITGDFADPALWDKPLQVMSKPYLDTSKKGTNTVSFSANWDTPFYAFWSLAGGNGQAVTLDTGVYRFLSPAVGEGTDYPDVAYATGGSSFLIRRPGSSCQLFSVNPGGDASAAAAPNFLISNALLTVSTSSDGSRNSVEFRRGFYNFYDPQGVAVATRNVKLFTGDVNVDEALVSFSGRDTFASLPKTLMEMTSKNHHFHVTDGACVTMNGFGWNGVSASNWDGAEILVRGKGSTLRITASTMFKNPNTNPSQERTVLKLRDGATLDMAISGDSASGFDVSAYSSYDFRDSTICYTNQQAGVNQFTVKQSSSGHGRLYSSNCVWNVGSAANKGNLYFGDGSGAPGKTLQLLAEDSVFNVKSYCVARDNSYVQFKRCTFNIAENDAYALRAINGGNMVFESCDIPYGPTVCNNSVIDIVGGHLTNRTATVQEIHINDTAGNYKSVMNVGGPCYIHRAIKFNTDSTDENMLGTLNFTGGVIRSAGIYNNRSRVAGFNTRAKFHVNGGTLKPSADDGRLVYQMDQFTVGPQGLVVDSDGMNCRLQASLSNEDGQEGCLIKKGAGTLRLVFDQHFATTGGESHPERGGDQQYSYSPSKTVIAEGELQVARTLSDDPVAMDTSLVVSNGAAVSLIACGSHNVSRLAVGTIEVDGGAFLLDPGDVIVVEGDAEIKDLLIQYSAPVSDTPQPFFVVKGNISEQSCRELSRAYWASGNIPEGKVPEVTVEEAGGAKTFSVKAVVPGGGTLSGERRWTGALDGEFTTAENWAETTLPLADECAVFSADVIRQDVSTEKGVASAGGLAFLGGNYVISGKNEIRLLGQHAASIGVTNGTQTIETSMDSDYSVAVRVENGATLELAGTQRGGGFVKTGDGSVVLSGENSFVRKADLDVVTTRESLVAVDGGRVVLANDKSLDGLAELRMGYGTLYVPEENSLLPVPGVKLMTDCAHSEKNLSLFRNDGDFTFFSADCSKDGKFGATLVKLGKGELRIDATDVSRTCNLPFGIGNMEAGGNFLDSSKPISFAGDVPPEVTDTTYAWGLSMVEGRTTVFGSGLGSKVLSNGVCVGLVTDDELSGPAPELIISNVTFDASIADARPIAVGVGAGVEKNKLKRAKLCVVDAKLQTKRLLIGHTWNENCADGTIVEFAVTNSTVRNTYDCLRISGSAARKSRTVVRAKGSAFYGEQWDVLGRNLDADFDACTLAKDDGAGHRAWFRISNTTGDDRMLFRNGATLEISKFKDANQNHIGESLVFAFDGATWDWDAGGYGDFTHCDNSGSVVGSARAIPSIYGQFCVELVNRGLLLPISEGVTLGCAAKVTGSGRLAVVGSGTLAFAAGSVQFTGVASAPDGVLDFSVAGKLKGVGVGAGVIRNAIFGSGCYLSPEFSGGRAVAMPHLDNCQTAASLAIDLSGVDKGLLVRGNTFDVATYSGAAPAVGHRILGTDDADLRGKCVVDGGKISVTLCDKADFGLLLIAR